MPVIGLNFPYPLQNSKPLSIAIMMTLQETKHPALSRKTAYHKPRIAFKAIDTLMLTE